MATILVKQKRDLGQASLPEGRTLVECGTCGLLFDASFWECHRAQAERYRRIMVSYLEKALPFVGSELLVTYYVGLEHAKPGLDMKRTVTITGFEVEGAPCGPCKYRVRTDVAIPVLVPKDSGAMDIGEPSTQVMVSDRHLTVTASVLESWVLAQGEGEPLHVCQIAQDDGRALVLALEV